MVILSQYDYDLIMACIEYGAPAVSNILKAKVNNLLKEQGELLQWKQEMERKKENNIKDSIATPEKSNLTLNPNKKSK